VYNVTSSYYTVFWGKPAQVFEHTWMSLWPFYKVPFSRQTRLTNTINQSLPLIFIFYFGGEGSRRGGRNPRSRSIFPRSKNNQHHLQFHRPLPISLVSSQSSPRPSGSHTFIPKPQHHGSGLPARRQNNPSMPSLSYTVHFSSPISVPTKAKQSSLRTKKKH